MSLSLARITLRAAQLALAVLAGAYLLSFADHARQLLGFGYPLDYGEGPLLAQVDQLRAGVPIWALYGDPGRPNALIVNYPPLYLMASAALSSLTGSALVAGRLIALASALGCVAASGLLAGGRRIGGFLLALLLLTVPVVREWAALMRVDLLGVCLGLWALVVLTGGRAGPDGAPAPPTPWRGIGAGFLLLACLFTKPSLIAAPGAAAGWLLWRLWAERGEGRAAIFRAGVAVATTVGLGGAALFGLLQWASGGWFALHVVAANANRWEADLARGFWEQQLRLRWPLGVAAALGALTLILPTDLDERPADDRRPTTDDRSARVRVDALVLPGLYTLFGAIVAAGVGKVGAYSNYFLELYAGLIWLVAMGAQRFEPQQGAGPSLRTGSTAAESRRSSVVGRPIPQWGFERLYYAFGSTFYALLAAALLFYPPLWDTSRLRPAGLIEPSPPRLAFGRYGLWADAARERDLLAALTRVGDALTSEVRAAGTTIFTDMPGVAAAAGVDSAVQAFEARQLFDQGLADDGALLLSLANGEPPLAVIDYLGNWLTPGAIEILQRRYAHDGSLGTFDLYRPVAIGPLQPLDQRFVTPEGSLDLAGYSLAAPVGAAYEPGELLALSLSWRRTGQALPGELIVVVRLSTPEGYPLLESERPLLYGVFAPEGWPEGALVQHMQPLALPAELPDGRFAISVGLRAGGDDLGEAQPIATIALEAQGGSQAETGHFVPATVQRAWAELGGVERAGLPLTPSIPFVWGRLQCFELLCLELRGGEVRQRPLGSKLYLAETTRGDGCLTGDPAQGGLCPGFVGAPERHAELGAPISGELLRNGWIVQWTEHARLERRDGADGVGLGRLGDESLRLPPGASYRWP